MPLTWEGTQNCLLPLNNRFCYFLEVGFHKIISWKYVYFDGLEVPSLSVVVHGQSRPPSSDARLSAAAPLSERDCWEERRGVLHPEMPRSRTACPKRYRNNPINYKFSGAAAPAEFTRTFTHVFITRVKCGMLLKPCLPSAVVLYGGAAFSFA